MPGSSVTYAQMTRPTLVFKLEKIEIVIAIIPNNKTPSVMYILFFMTVLTNLI